MSTGASIDSGSFDPEGGPVVLSQDPAGPYGLGATDVTLLVEDDEGASDTCQAQVTVVDEAVPKARLRVGARTLLEAAVDTLRRLTPDVVLACGVEDRYGELGLERVRDRVADGGPLAGLEAALERADGWVLALACDMPRADVRVFEALLERARERGLDACLLETEGGLEPLFAVYRRACLAAVRRAIDAGERKMTSFHGARGLRIGALAVRELPPDLTHGDHARNLNTPEELSAERETTR